jgi:hypothetical protein
MLIRAAIIALWLTLLGAHIAGRMDAKGAERDDLEARAGSRLDYLLMLHDHDRDRKVGTVSMICVRHADANTWDLTTVGRLTDLGVIPDLGQVLRSRLQSIGAGDDLSLDLHETFGPDRRLTALDVGLNVGTNVIHASGLCDQTGMHGAWDLNGIPAKSFAFTTPASGTCQGFMLVASMPAGLRPGMQFSYDLLGTDTAVVQPTLNRTVFTVHEFEDVDTEAGVMSLMHVEMRADGAPTEDIWCDGTGIVYRQRFAQAGLALELHAAVLPGSQRWPPRNAEGVREKTPPKSTP